MDNAPEPPTPPETLSSPGYSRVSPAQATEIVRLKRINPKITYEQIAAAVGVKSIATVSYWLRELNNDTTPEARKLLKTNALRASMKIVEQIDHKDSRVGQGAAKAVLAGAGVGEQAPVQVGVRVVVGSATEPAGPDPFTSHHNQAVIETIPASD